MGHARGDGAALASVLCEADDAPTQVGADDQCVFGQGGRCVIAPVVDEQHLEVTEGVGGVGQRVHRCGDSGCLVVHRNDQGSGRFSRVGGWPGEIGGRCRHRSRCPGRAAFDSTVPPVADRLTFEDIWRRLDGVEGWLSEGQARMLHEAAKDVSPPGSVVEIGSFRGRSAIVLGSSAAEGVQVVAIDPHAGTDRGPREMTTSAETGETDHEAFVRNLTEAGVVERIDHVRAFSDRAHDEVDGDIDVLFIDGAHRYAPARSDIVEWGGRVKPGGLMLIHDSFNSVGVTLAQLRELLLAAGWVFEGRSRSLSQYRKVDLQLTARARNAGRQLASARLLRPFGRDQGGLERRKRRPCATPRPHGRRALALLTGTFGGCGPQAEVHLVPPRCSSETEVLLDDLIRLVRTEYA